MATLQAVLKDVQGIGRDEQMRLATFLEQNKLRGARAMEKLIHGPGGVVMGASIAAVELQDDLSESGKKMIDEITELMKELKSADPMNWEHNLAEIMNGVNKPRAMPEAYTRTKKRK